MDAFEQMMKDMKRMHGKDLNEAEARFMEMCNCPKCPSYTKCAKNAQELIFCLKGKSFMCISEEKGCICPGCPVWDECGLKHKFFCIRGAEKSLRYEQALWGTKIP